MTVTCSHPKVIQPQGRGPDASCLYCDQPLRMQEGDWQLAPRPEPRRVRVKRKRYGYRRDESDE
jgi:hypothetical protein